MLQAQEMFSNSNKLTRSEKAQILGFIAGSRGNILNIIYTLYVIFQRNKNYLI